MHITRGIAALALASVVSIAPLGALGATASQPGLSKPPLSAQQTLAEIRRVFRSHRPPAPYVTYTLVREEQAANGYPDYADSYTYHIWCRTSDRACLGRKVFRDDARGPLEFLRPAFNEDRDPGPPTADMFEQAPLHPHPVEFVPTPEPTAEPLRVIGSVKAIGETEYRVRSMTVEGELLHLSVVPRRDPDRNRLREIWVDKHTYELKKLVATDKLFVDHGGVYPVAFTITMGNHRGRPVVTDIHGVVGGGYDDDGNIVDFHFQEILFPVTLPAWYFDARGYAQHANSDDAPQ
ncbi:MAG TPA: hypothetical protein VIG51_08290 [Candidatus Baltobacteraceae bacterium]|jgi:hypothetical protein